MLTKILGALFLLIGVVFFYLGYEVHSAYAYGSIPAVAGAVLVYVFSPQINWWWYERYPPDLPPGLWPLLERHNLFYQALPEAERRRFRARVVMFLSGNEFIPQGMKHLPEDVKTVIAANAVQLTFGLDDFLFPHFEHIVVYPHPFPSPMYPEHLHVSEVYEEGENGAIVLCMDHLMRGFLQPERFFNIGLYEYARVFRLSRAGVDFPHGFAASWEALEEISGFSRESLQTWIGLEDLDPWAVGVVHFFTFPMRFQVILPELFTIYARLFRVSAGMWLVPSGGQ